MQLQSEMVETCVCQEYAHFLCDGSGKIWVCHLHIPSTFMQKIYENFFLWILFSNAKKLFDALCFWSPLSGVLTCLLNFQAREDEIWGDLDEHKLMEIFGMDSSIYMHTKLRAMEASNRLLETRTNFEGYAILQLQLWVWKIFKAACSLAGSCPSILINLFFFNFQFRIKELKCPDLLAEQYKPFKCQIQQWISKHALVLVPVFALVFHLNAALPSLL